MKDRRNGYKFIREILPYMSTTCGWCSQPLNIEGIKAYIKHMETPRIERVRRYFNRKSIDVTIDHIVPISANGNNEIYNLQLMHRKCNEQKGCR